jgi:hypothetical protein
MANPQKINVNGLDFEWAAAEVISVDYTQKTRDRLYTIYCKILSSGASRSPSDLIQARALHANIKQIPIIGEIVFVCLAPTPHHAGATSEKEYYYTMPISIQSSVHHNGLAGANTVQLDNRSQNEKISVASLGIPLKLTDSKLIKQTIDPTFPERKDLYPIQPFSGDLIIEGRWGQSIRLGSTVDMRRKYISNPKWDKGTGDTGNPITIISNGTNPKGKTFNQFHIESPDDDDSSIWLTSGQQVKFKPASKYSPSILDKEVGLFKKNDYGGNQVIIASDRIILNSKKQEIIGFAKEGIGFATEKCLVLNAKNILELESSKISLGFNATSPILLGDRVVELLGQILHLLIDMNQTLARDYHGTTWGQTTPSLFAGEYIGYVTQLNTFLSRLPSLASKFAFVNEFSGGSSKSELAKFEKLKSSKYKLPVPQKIGGDSSGGISFDNWSSIV